MRQNEAPTPWYWLVISGVFLVISIGFTIWSTNQEWEFSHDCQCGTPYGTSQGDYVTPHIVAQVIPSVLIIIGLLLHPLAGIVVSGAVTVVNVIHLSQLMMDPEPGSSSVPMHAMFLLLLSIAGLLISIMRLIELRSWIARNRFFQ